MCMYILCNHKMKPPTFIKDIVKKYLQPYDEKCLRMKANPKNAKRRNLFQSILNYWHRTAPMIPILPTSPQEMPLVPSHPLYSSESRVTFAKKALFSMRVLSMWAAGGFCRKILDKALAGSVFTATKSYQSQSFQTESVYLSQHCICEWTKLLIPSIVLCLISTSQQLIW